MQLARGDKNLHVLRGVRRTGYRCTMSYTHFGQLCQRCKKSYTPLCIEKNIPGLHYIGVKLVKSRKNAYAHVQHWIYYRSYLNYYLSFDVCACFHLSFCKKKKNFVQNGLNSQIRWTDISNSRIQARRAWRLVIYILAYSYKFQLKTALLALRIKYLSTHK